MLDRTTALIISLTSLAGCGGLDALLGSGVRGTVDGDPWLYSYATSPRSMSDESSYFAILHGESAPPVMLYIPKEPGEHELEHIMIGSGYVATVVFTSGSVYVEPVGQVIRVSVDVIDGSGDYSLSGRFNLIACGG